MNRITEIYTEEDTNCAANVILKIIRNEGSIADDVEYPSEFQPAYLKLLELDIVRIRKEEFIPGTNFNAACELGIGKYLEKRKQKPQVESSAFKVFIGGILATTHYLWNVGRRKQPS